MTTFSYRYLNSFYKFFTDIIFKITYMASFLRGTVLWMSPIMWVKHERTIGEWIRSYLYYTFRFVRLFIKKMASLSIFSSGISSFSSINSIVFDMLYSVWEYEIFKNMK